LSAQISFDLSLACVSRPVSGCGLPEEILQIQSCTPFHKEADYFSMACSGSLMQRSCEGMASYWVVSVWVFARVKQQLDDLGTTKIGC
jgi:hypothetical protein